MKINKVVNLCMMVGVVAIAFVAYPASSNGQKKSPASVADVGCSLALDFLPYTVDPSDGAACASAVYQAPSTGYIGINQTSPTAQLDVTGAINASPSSVAASSTGNYQILEDPVLSIGWPASDVVVANENLYVGVLAGAQGFTQNPGTGDTGIGNTFVGYNAAFHNQGGGNNVAVGAGAGYRNSSGNDNTYLGRDAGFGVLGETTGSSNTVVGFESGFGLTSGGSNTFLGELSCVNIAAGSNDICIGEGAGPASDAANSIWIGTEKLQTATYIAGIYGSVVSSGLAVSVLSSGQLGVAPSSLRFKEQVRDMGDSTDALMKLRPVTFLYKPEYDKGERTRQYGLIAEEVAKIYPDLVAYDSEGKPYAVRYQHITSMLLNEAQKQHRRAEDQAELIKAQQQEIEGLMRQLQVQNATLQERLSRLEAAARVELAAAK
jgi:hypothetical protein